MLFFCCHRRGWLYSKWSESQNFWTRIVTLIMIKTLEVIYVMQSLLFSPDSSLATVGWWGLFFLKDPFKENHYLLIPTPHVFWSFKVGSFPSVNLNPPFLKFMLIAFIEMKNSCIQLKIFPFLKVVIPSFHILLFPWCNSPLHLTFFFFSPFPNYWNATFLIYWSFA